MLARLAACVLTFALASLGSAGAAWGYAPPPIQGYVTDTAHALSREEGAALDEKLGAYRSCSANHVAVFFAGSLDGSTVEQVALTTFNAWKLGDAARNNGVLLVIAPNERRVRVETGKGVRGALTDADASRILREQVSPHLKSGHFFEAADDGTTAIETALELHAKHDAGHRCDAVPARIAAAAPTAAASAPSAAPPPAAPSVEPPPDDDSSFLQTLPVALIVGLTAGVSGFRGMRRDEKEGWEFDVLFPAGFAVAFALVFGALGGTWLVRVLGRDLALPAAIAGSAVSFGVPLLLARLRARFPAWPPRRADTNAGDSGDAGGDFDASTTQDSDMASPWEANDSPTWDSGSSSSSSFSDSTSTSSVDVGSSGTSDTGYSGGGGSSDGGGASDSY